MDDLVYRLDSCLLQLFFRNRWCITNRWSIFHPCATAPHRRFLSSIIPGDSSINVATLGAGTNAEKRILTGIYLLLLSLNTPEDLAQVLTLRQQLAKRSVKKYQAIQNAACNDHRTRGMFQFYEANRNGCWAGRLIQLQNLPQNHMDDLDAARELVRIGDYDSLSILYDDIPYTLSQLIRTAFIAKPGYKFYVADFSAI